MNKINKATKVTMQVLMDKLATNGGEIVCSSSCTQDEINTASATGNLVVTDSYIGYVYRIVESRTMVRFLRENIRKLQDWIYKVETVRDIFRNELTKLGYSREDLEALCEPNLVKLRSEKEGE